MHSFGKAEVRIALIDGPIFSAHPAFAGATIRELPKNSQPKCTQLNSLACKHGTSVAGILVAARDNSVPGICPRCTLLLRTIFPEVSGGARKAPNATEQELAEAINECIEAGASVINLSSAFVQSSPQDNADLHEALNYAARRGVIIVAASGNEGILGSSTVTRHSWVIPVASCDAFGRPMKGSNLGSSIGRHGLSAPGENIMSLGTDGQLESFSGTSAAAPFVTGAIALLASEFPQVSAFEIRSAVTRRCFGRRGLIVPPLLDAWAAYQELAAVKGHRRAR